MMINNTFRAKNKYELLLEEVQAKKQLEDNFIFHSCQCTCTLNDYIESRKKFDISTYTPIDEAFHFEQYEETENKVMFLYQTEKNKIFPIIYRQLLFFCGPIEFKGEKDKFNLNRKCIIFSREERELINRDIFVKYIHLFCYINRGDRDDNFVMEYAQKICENIIEINYKDLGDLILKVNFLGTLLRKQEYKNVSLVIIDDINYEENISIEKVTKEEKGFFPVFREKFRNSMNKKRRTNEEDTITDASCIKKVFELMNDLFKRYNFNLIYTFYDYYNLKAVTNINNRFIEKYINDIKVNLQEEDPYELHFYFYKPKISTVNEYSYWIFGPDFFTCDKEEESLYFGILSYVKTISKLVFYVYQQDNNGTISKIYQQEIEPVSYSSSGKDKLNDSISYIHNSNNPLIERENVSSNKKINYSEELLMSNKKYKNQSDEYEEI